MKRHLICACSAALLAVCLLVLPAQAAGSWSDLPSSHWAYNAIVRASERGIVSGDTDGTMRPDATLTWGEYLTMLSLTFQGEDYLNYPAPEGAHWSYPHLGAVAAAGGIQGFMPVRLDTLDQPISRQDAAVLTAALLDKGALQDAPVPDAADFAQLPADYQPGVARSYALGLISGYEDGTFQGENSLTRAQGVVVILNALGDPQSVVTPPEETDDDDNSWIWGWGWENDYGDDPLLWPGENTAKYMRLFGSEDKRRFASKEEAEANMVTVEVPIWKLKSDDTKTSSKATFKIHKALADEVVEMFTEIYNDPEQFPISSIGGYSWRGDTATGEHNCGTAIDINPTANYQVRDGEAMVGTHWTPGEDPLSIPVDGSVVRIFRAHGWDWGGDAWAGHSDPAYDYHDYMHFSYMGK